MNEAQRSQPFWRTILPPSRIPKSLNPATVQCRPTIGIGLQSFPKHSALYPHRQIVLVRMIHAVKSLFFVSSIHLPKRAAECKTGKVSTLFARGLDKKAVLTEAAPTSHKVDTF